LTVVEETIRRLEKIQSPIGKIVNAKVKNVEQKKFRSSTNQSFSTDQVISNIEYLPSDIVVKYALVTSVEVKIIQPV